MKSHHASFIHLLAACASTHRVQTLCSLSQLLLRFLSILPCWSTVCLLSFSHFKIFCWYSHTQGSRHPHQDVRSTCIRILRTQAVELPSLQYPQHTINACIQKSPQNSPLQFALLRLTCLLLPFFPLLFLLDPECVHGCKYLYCSPLYIVVNISAPFVIFYFCT